MLFNVPQYIDVEDKIAGPFTAKQLLWLFGLAAILFVLWSIFKKNIIFFFIIAIPVTILFLALAFYRPYKQPLIKYLFYGLTFAFKPKIYVWKRIHEKSAPPRPKKQEKEKTLVSKEEKAKKMTPENIAALARVLDTEGKEKNEKIMELITRRRAVKKAGVPEFEEIDREPGAARPVKTPEVPEEIK